MGSGSSKGAAGFRIFSIIPGGPGDVAGLEVFFDFVVEVNGVVVESEKQSFFSMVKDYEGKRVKLTVYNCRTHSLRDVYLIPRQWGGQGLLGLVVKYDSIEDGENQGLRILELLPNSPASVAGLIAYKDYIIGSKDVIVRDLDDLGELLSSSIGKNLSLTVYNTDKESSREVSIIPNRDWGGEGLLGCGIGTGILHRIPMSRKSLVPQAPDTADESDEQPQHPDSPKARQEPEKEPVPSLLVTNNPVSPFEPSSSPFVEVLPIGKNVESDSKPSLGNPGSEADVSKLFD